MRACVWPVCVSALLSFALLIRYTSILGIDKERLEAFYGKPITIATRETVRESEANTIEFQRRTHRKVGLHNWKYHAGQ